ncbi:chemotaxis-specific protein-glutamate methyltransferase CheB [Conexibacter sp. SYSU D00693]|uniref:chemotaxis-specific protein-glutamate methyltransferase CheB n=1 Tax=Conexibacter sp. SYSU D00693 TaxID=2812560 RepID=UPI00196B9D45|nr:chemotaxis-specific protein-glutamate methyltransferase CheB [Conexibacter sp. SYSU D00693]
MATTAGNRPAARTGSGTRILVCDDSSFMRRLLSQALRDQGFEVVGEAADGDEALALHRRLRPDAMTLDLAMPGLDGIGVLRALRSGNASVPVVVVSAFSPAHGARAVDALAEGAFDLVAKPAIGEPFDAFAKTLAGKLEAAAGSTRSAAAPRPSARPAAAPAAASVPARRPRIATASAKDRVVVIATSTGGPRALAAVVPGLPGALGAGGLIVQHMPEGFTASLAARLDRAARIGVREAVDGDRLDPTQLLIAPGGKHLRLTDGDVLRLTETEPIGGLRPRADLTIADVAKRFKDRVVLCVMTGMGADGLAGARVVKEHGGRIIAEAEHTCTVYGMPRAVAEAGLVDEVLPLGELAEAIAS